MGTRRAALIHLRGAIGGGTEDDTTTPKLSSYLLERIGPEAGRARYSKEAENVPLDGHASRLSYSDARCLRDGACASRLATLVRDGLSSAVHHYGDFGVGLRHAEVSEEKQCVGPLPRRECSGTDSPEGIPLTLAAKR